MISFIILNSASGIGLSIKPYAQIGVLDCDSLQREVVEASSRE